MKKIFAALLVLTLVFCNIPFDTGAAPEQSGTDFETFAKQASSMISIFDANFSMNAKETILDTEQFIVENDALVPLKYTDDVHIDDEPEIWISSDVLAEALGGESHYDANANQLTITLDNDSIDVADSKFKMLNEPQKRTTNNSERVMVPLEDIANDIGADVFQDGDELLLFYSFQTSRLIVEATQRPNDQEALQIIGGYNNLYLIQYGSPSAAALAQKRLLSYDYVKHAEPDVIMELDDTGDPNYEYKSWGPEAVGSDVFNAALLAKYGSVENIPEVKVAVLDTGAFMNHSFFDGRLVNGYNFVNTSQPPEDDGGHGSHVTGIIIDNTLPNVKVMPLKCGENSSAYLSLVILAMEHAILNGQKS